MANYYVSGYQPPNNITSREGVKALQQQLNAQGANLKVDGIWGAKTQAAYKAGGHGGGNSHAQQYAAGISSYMKSLQPLFDAPAIDYTPTPTAELQNGIAGYLRPGVELAIKNRKEQTATNRAELDADAYSRGMGASTYVTDVKSRQMDAESEDIAAMESSYAAAVAQQLMEAVQRERERYLNVEMYNAQQRTNAQQLAFATAQGAYADYLNQLQSAQKKSSSKSASKNANATSLKNIRIYLGNISDAQRHDIYTGATAQGRVARDEIIASVGPSGYLQLQEEYRA